MIIRGATTGGEPNLPVYLHFLNRELARAVQREFTLEEYGHYILLSMVVTDAPLLSSIAFVWESGILGSELGPVLSHLIANDQLMLVSEFATLDEFVSSSQRLYRHDRLRYPMYFNDPGQSYMTAQPNVLKNTSTTFELERWLRTVVAGGISVLHGLPDSDTSRIIGARGLIDRALGDRDGRALTLSIFESGQADRSEVLPIGRLLSVLHLRHYLELTGSDILTGIRHLRYCDALSRNYPHLEVRLLEPVLRYVGLGSEARRTAALVLAEHRGSPQHRLFLTILTGVLGGLNDVDLSVHGADVPGLGLRVNQLRAIFSEQPPQGSTQSLLLNAPYDRAVDRLAYLNLALERRMPNFKAFRERYLSMADQLPPRVLIMVATEVERDAFLERFSPSEVRRSFAAQHTIFHLGVVNGVEVFLAQSAPGTEAPAAMTLTAVDLIDHTSSRYLILAGICFGLKEQQQDLGDVLVSTQLLVFDPKKVIDRDGVEHAIPRGDKVSPSVLLLDRFRSGSVDWSGARIHFGPILSANTLVNSNILRRRLTEVEPDAIGGEMEGAGAYAAGAKRKVDWIVAKAVSDWGYDKTDDVQRTAADNVASYVYHVLSIGGLSLEQDRS